MLSHETKIEDFDELYKKQYAPKPKPVNPDKLAMFLANANKIAGAKPAAAPAPAPGLKLGGGMNPDKLAMFVAKGNAIAAKRKEEEDQK